MTEIFSTHGEPALDRPVLVVSLEGWVDAGLGATTANFKGGIGSASAGKTASSEPR